MAGFYLVPNWFFGMDMFFELAFAIITLIVALYSFKVYKLSCQRQSRLFAWSFIFFSISYFIQSFLNFIILQKIEDGITNSLELGVISLLNSQGIYFHMLFFLVGLVTLTYLVLKIKNVQVYTLLLLVSLFSFILSLNKIYWFYFLSSLLLVFISWNYFFNFLKNKRSKTFLVFLGFLFLLFGVVHFIFSINHELFYALGHFFELAGYGLILTNLILILKNGKKKK